MSRMMIRLHNLIPSLKLGILSGSGLLHHVVQWADCFRSVHQLDHEKLSNGLE